MNFDTFSIRFNASNRTKNFNQPFDTSSKKTQANRRLHFQRMSSELPLEFIRLDPWEAEYLFMVAARAKIGIVETGRYNGGSSFLMACANERIPIHTIDIAPQDDGRFQAEMAKFGIGQNVNIIVGDSQKSKYPAIGGFDFLFIDGDHSYEGCTADIENWYPDLTPGGHMILHDSYHGSPVMDACIDFMARHDPIVHVSPWKQANHSLHPTGSFAHFQKRFESPMRST